MKDLITIGIGIIILPSLLLIISPLIDNILTVSVIDNINRIINSIDVLIGSRGTNMLFCAIGIIIVMPFIRRFFSFFNSN